VSANQGKTFLLIAVGLGGAAAVVGYFGLSSLASQTAASSNKNFHNVVVVGSDLTFGMKLDRPMLRVVRYPKESVPQGAFSSIDSVVGQTTKVFMSAREPVTATKLSSRGGGLSMLVRPTMRAASLEVNQVSGVSGFVLPGDRVDVLVTVDPRAHTEDAITRTILQNIEVLAAGQKTEQQDNKPITVQSVTLLVDPSGAETLALALHEGKIHLVIRNPEDQAEVEVNALSTREMLGRTAPIAAAPVRATPAPRRTSVASHSSPAKSQMAVAKQPKVRIIRNANVTETPAVADTASN
jgi:pilus assembly protein CpaB